MSKVLAVLAFGQAVVYCQRQPDGDVRKHSAIVLESRVHKLLKQNRTETGEDAEHADLLFVRHVAEGHALKTRSPEAIFQPAHDVAPFVEGASSGYELRGEREQAVYDEAEQLQVQLAGCSVAALGWAKDEQEAKPGDYGYSQSYQDVVDLRKKYEEKLAENPDSDKVQALEKELSEAKTLAEDAGAKLVEAVKAHDETKAQLAAAEAELEMIKTGSSGSTDANTGGAPSAADLDAAVETAAEEAAAKAATAEGGNS